MYPLSILLSSIISDMPLYDSLIDYLITFVNVLLASFHPFVES